MPKPIIFQDSRTPDEKFDPDAVHGFTPGYIPGYTEQVQANDIAKADALRFREAHRAAKRADGGQGVTQEDLYKQIGKGPAPLPIELTWLRVAAPGGQNSASADVELAKAAMEGWVLCTEDVLQKYGYGFPPAAHKQADGSIRRMDLALYYRSGALGRKWDEYRAHQAIEAEGSQIPAQFTAGGYAANTVVIQDDHEQIDIAH